MLLDRANISLLKEHPFLEAAEHPDRQMHHELHAKECLGSPERAIEAVDEDEVGVYRGGVGVGTADRLERPSEHIHKP